MVGDASRAGAKSCFCGCRGIFVSGFRERIERIISFACGMRLHQKVSPAVSNRSALPMRYTWLHNRQRCHVTLDTRMQT